MFCMFSGRVVGSETLQPDSRVDSLGPDLKLVPGVVEHGLFIGLAERALLGAPDGSVEVLEAGGG